MAMNIGGGARGPSAAINITPLVDVVLVLLILFMAVAPMMRRSEDVHLPLAQHVAPGAARRPLVVTITAQRAIDVDGAAVPASGLAAAVTRALEGSPDRTVVLRGDASLAWKDVRAPMERIRQAQAAAHSGAPGVSLATERPSP